VHNAWLAAAEHDVRVGQVHCNEPHLHFRLLAHPAWTLCAVQAAREVLRGKSEMSAGMEKVLLMKLRRIVAVRRIVRAACEFVCTRVHVCVCVFVCAGLMSHPKPPMAGGWWAQTSQAIQDSPICGYWGGEERREGVQGTLELGWGRLA